MQLLLNARTVGSGGGLVHLVALVRGLKGLSYDPVIVAPRRSHIRSVLESRCPDAAIRDESLRDLVRITRPDVVIELSNIWYSWPSRALVVMQNEAVQGPLAGWRNLRSVRGVALGAATKLSSMFAAGVVRLAQVPGVSGGLIPNCFDPFEVMPLSRSMSEDRSRAEGAEDMTVVVVGGDAPFRSADAEIEVLVSSGRGCVWYVGAARASAADTGCGFKRMGHLSREDMVGMMHAADWIIFPSRIEASSVALLEAIALRKRISARRIPGNITLANSLQVSDAVQLYDSPHSLDYGETRVPNPIFWELETWAGHYVEMALAMHER